MASLALSEETTLPDDGFAGALAGRVWRPDVAGPSVVAVRADGVFDVSADFPTMRDLCEVASPAEALRGAKGPRLGSLADILAHTARDARASDRPWLLAPVDLQAIKAAGITFVEFMLERVIEERARGSREGAAKEREAITAILGEELGSLKPGSPPRCGSRTRWSRRAAGRKSQKSASARCGGLHQEPADVGGRLRRRRGVPQGVAMEQSRARGRAGGRLQRPHCRRDARQ